MARLNSQKFTIEGFKEQQSWIGKLFSPLNQFLGEVISAFNNNLTVEENLSAEIKEIKFVNNSVNFPLKFQSKLSSNPKGLWVCYCYDDTISEMNFAASIWCNWAYNNGTIQINSIKGLTATRAYTLRIYVVYK